LPLSEADFNNFFPYMLTRAFLDAKEIEMKR